MIVYLMTPRLQRFSGKATKATLRLRGSSSRCSFVRSSCPMTKFFENTPVLVFLFIATTLEVSGDAVIRLAIYNHAGVTRLTFMLAGAVLLFGYGFTLNLAPLEFREVVGLYIATLFVVWQIINFIAFRTLPSLPILLGGVLIVAGGLIITFWKVGA